MGSLDGFLRRYSAFLKGRRAQMHENIGIVETRIEQLELLLSNPI